MALGKCRELTRPDHDADRLPNGFYSTHALGVERPIPAQSEHLGDVLVPCGEVERFPGGGMGANEFIVYNTRQIKMRYLVRIKVNR